MSYLFNVPCIFHEYIIFPKTTNDIQSLNFAVVYIIFKWIRCKKGKLRNTIKRFCNILIFDLKNHKSGGYQCHTVNLYYESQKSLENNSQ